MKKTFTPKIILIIVIFLVLLSLSIKLSISWHKFLTNPIIPNGHTFHYILKPGGNIRELAKNLQEQGYLKHPYYLILYSHFINVTRYLKAGEYKFTPGTTVKIMLDKMIRGDIVIHYITLVEGWNFRHFKSALASAPALKDNIKDMTDANIMHQLGSKYENPEGLFFPDTYSYKYGNTALQILQLSYQKMQSTLEKAWQNRASNLPYQSAYQALIVASLIEKETGYEPEKALIAGVICNRLQKNMYLQIDPTVIYSVRNTYDGKITLQDLRSESLYNTYRHKGLPPTPIAMPGLTSILAAMHPAKTDYLYFVAKGDGTHHFSKNLHAHDVAIKEFLLAD